MRTFSIPIGLRYFNANGLFAGITGTFVDQEVKRAADATLADGSDNFFIVDLSFGWRFAERRGIFSVGVQNLFDQDFMYQDDSYREFGDEPVIGPYIPERTIFAKLTFSF